MRNNGVLKNIAICILDKDKHYVKAFISAVALTNEGFSVTGAGVCRKDCRKDFDVCIRFDTDDKDVNGKNGVCEKAFSPDCGKYAGVSMILKEAKAFVLDRLEAENSSAGGKRSRLAAHLPDLPPLPAGTLLCIYAYTGGVGTSAAAIGIGRELARYRGERVLYLSLEDTEDPGLFPEDLRAMRAEETLYRYLRILDQRGGSEIFESLFRAAAARDEYGLYRLAPDDGLCSLTDITADELYYFLLHFVSALGLSRVILDFGTRLRSLETFLGVLEDEEDAYVIEAVSADENSVRKRKDVFRSVSGDISVGISEEKKLSLSMVIPFCEEDIRNIDGRISISLMNAFGLAVKELCDEITEDSPAGLSLSMCNKDLP